MPSSGHFIAGKYYLGFFKLFLILTPILSTFIGFLFYYNDEDYKNISVEKYDKTRENEVQLDYNEQNNKLHVANRENKQIQLSLVLPTIITFVSLTILVVMHIIDLLFYLFCLYYDGYGVPLV